MSKLITNTIRHTGGSADNITLDNSQNVTCESTLIVDANLGVGETAPEEQLHITHASAPGIQLEATGGGPYKSLIKMGGNDLKIMGSNGQIQFFQGNADGDSSSEKLRLSSHGGIAFNGDTAAANCLDDYEEGTWTPSYNNDGDWVHGAITVHRYIKVGNQVTVSGNIRSNENTAGNNAFYITSLPFTSADISNMKWVGSMGGDNGWNNTNTSLIALISHNSQHLRLHKNNTGVGMGDISFGGDVGPDANIYYTITYQAA